MHLWLDPLCSQYGFGSASRSVVGFPAQALANHELSLFFFFFLFLVSPFTARLQTAACRESPPCWLPVGPGMPLQTMLHIVIPGFPPFLGPGIHCPRCRCWGSACQHPLHPASPVHPSSGSQHVDAVKGWVIWKGQAALGKTRPALQYLG